MYSKLKLFGHPIHPMLIAFPVALYTAAFVAFLIFQIGGDPFWFRVGLTANVGGVVMAVIIALFGFLDWAIGIPGGTAAKGDGLKHMALNVIALVLFVINLVVYLGQWVVPPSSALLGVILSLIGVLVTVGAGFYGWTLIQFHHVGVELTLEQGRLEPAENQPKVAETTSTYAH
jgi:uncharacterized membrane protein